MSNRMRDLTNQKDWADYLIHNQGVPLIFEIKPQTKRNEKQAMYAYYHKVVLGVAMESFTHAGYEMMDKVKADHLLKTQCAQAIIIKDGEEIPYLEDKSKMTKDRLHKYITDCIHFLVEYMDARVPDSEAYINKQKYGHEFRSVSNRKD